MNRAEVLKKIAEIVMDITDTENVSLTNESVPADVENWDSLNHIQIIVDIEKEYDVRFTTPEIQSFKIVGDVADMIDKKLAEK